MIVYFEQIKGFKLKRTLKRLAKEVWMQTNQTYSKLSVSLSFVSETQIAQLNKEHRQKDKITDVLSFPMLELKPFDVVNPEQFYEEIDPSNKQIHLGDVVICLQKAIEQSKEYNHSLLREICFLSVHGMLHILGFDHETKEEEEQMFALTEKILKKHKLER